jgi:prevent-host-death family protein
MEHVGIQELKTNPARIFARVVQGETLMVTQRGRPVGRIVPPVPTREEVIAAAEGLKTLRREIVAQGGGISAEQIVSSTHEGHRW